MKKLCFLLLPVILSSCLGFKMTRIYEPVKKENLLSGLELKLDSGYIEQSRGAERLKLDFITVNKNTNSILYSFFYYNPSNFTTNYLWDKVTHGWIAEYKESSLMDVSYFEKNYEQFIINNDTLLFNQGLNGIYKYLKLTGIALGKFSTSNGKILDEIFTVVPKNEYTNSFTAATNNDFPRNTFYNGTPDLSIHELNNSGTFKQIKFADWNDLKENSQNQFIYNAKSKIGNELTTLSGNKNIVLLHEYKKKILSEVTDAYSLISDYVFNEIVDSTILNQSNSKGYIKLKLIKSNDKNKVGIFFTVTSGLLLFTPNLVGYPFTSAKYKVNLEATIYNNENQKIKTYSTVGIGKAYMALYWGYGIRNTIRTTQSKAVYSALTELKKQIFIDKDEIEKKLNNF